MKAALPAGLPAAHNVASRACVRNENIMDTISRIITLVVSRTSVRNKSCVAGVKNMKEIRRISRLRENSPSTKELILFGKNVSKGQ